MIQHWHQFAPSFKVLSLLEQKRRAPTIFRTITGKSVKSKKQNFFRFSPPKKVFFISSTVVFHFYAAHFYAAFGDESQNLSSRYFPVLCRFLIIFYSGRTIFCNYSKKMLKINKIYTILSKFTKTRQKSTKICPKSTKFVKNSEKPVKNQRKFVENHQKIGTKICTVLCRLSKISSP